MKNKAIIFISLLLSTGTLTVSAEEQNNENKKISTLETTASNESNFNRNEHIKKDFNKNECMKRGYDMVTEFKKLMEIPTGETDRLLTEIKASSIWLNLQDDEKKMLAEFLFKTNKSESNKKKIRFKKELTKSIIERCENIK